MKRDIVAFASELAVVVASVGCASAPAPDRDREHAIAKGLASSEPNPPATPSAPVVQGTLVREGAPPPAATKAEALAALEPFVVGAVGRRTLLSWTTRKQAEKIAAGQPVLSLVESTQFGPSGFDWALDGKVKKGHRLAKLLFHQGFAKKRFAWPNAYATALGAGGGRYGSVLLRIDLAKDALIVDLVHDRVVDVNDKPVDVAEAEAHPERIAAVYWESLLYREYVIVNEAALDSVAFGTREANEPFQREVAMFKVVVSALAVTPRAEAEELLARFAKTLAFTNIAPADHVRRLAREAEEVPPGALAYAPKLAREFALGPLRAALKDPKCKQQKSFDVSYSRVTCVPADRCEMSQGKCVIRQLTLNGAED